MEPYQCIDLVNMENVALVSFKDNRIMDPARIEQMGKELLSLAEKYQTSELVINFENVRFFSSAAINKLIILEKRVRAGGGKLRLNNLRPEVRDLFNYTKLDSVFNIEDESSNSL
jgi:anti-anti-sigma factor